MSNQFTKDPDATLNYQVDWSAWLGADTLVASQWIVPAGITKASTTFSSQAATIWLSGGRLGVSYTLTNRITTAAGCVNDQSIVIRVRDA